MEVEGITCGTFASNVIDNTENLLEEKYNCPIVKQTLKKIIKSENYTAYQIASKTLPASNGNFLGTLIEIDIKGRTEDGDKENCIFVKHIVPGEGIIKGLIDLEQSYRNEVFMYTELQNIFDELYEEAGVPEKKRLRIAKSYECNNHVIILENLSRRGFRSLPNLAMMPIHFAQDSIKQLAKFHALSFVLEHKRTDFFEKKIKTLKVSIQIEDDDGNVCEPWKNFITMMINQAFEHVNPHFKLDKEQFIEKALKKIRKYYSGEIDSIKCMCHGDSKTNNILYRKVIDEEVETILIDYQIINYGSPMIDILIFLYLGTDRTFRKDHMEHLKNIYHEALTEALSDFNLDINNVFPRKLFERDFKYYLELGLLYSFALLPMLLTEDPEFFKNDMTGEIPKTNDIYKERLNGVIDEFIELGML